MVINRQKNIEDEEHRLIDSASELIRIKIRNIVCNLNIYPVADKAFNDIGKVIPPHLLYKE